MSELKDWLKSKVEVAANTHCWIFQGAKDRNGYGRVFVQGREVKAPRAFYEAFVAAIPGGAKLLHHLPQERCVGPSCCNPAHVRVAKPRMWEPALNVCPKGHIITAENAYVEMVGTQLKIRCRTCKNND
jgi:hypothetical protein